MLTEALTAEHAAREVLEGAPLAVRQSLWMAWVGIGLALTPPGASEAVLGWQIRKRSDRTLLVGADSRFLGLAAELAFGLEEDALLMSTFVHHQNRLARAVWRWFVQPLHPPIVRYMLNHGADRIGRPR